MTIKTQCLICDSGIRLLKEIQNAKAAIEIWAYGLNSSQVMGRMAFEFAIRQNSYWYEIYQRFITLDDEEYAEIHIIKHECVHAATEGVPFSPHERVYQTFPEQKEQSWTKIVTLSPPLSISVYRDSIYTCNNKQDGAKIVRYKCADVAIAFETTASNILLQTTTYPYFLRLCYTQEELDDIKVLWEFHIDEDEEIEQYRVQDSDEYFHCQRLVDSSRTKINLSERVSTL